MPAGLKYSRKLYRLDDTVLFTVVDKELSPSASQSFSFVSFVSFVDAPSPADHLHTAGHYLSAV